MARRKFVISPSDREDLILRADDLVLTLVEGDLDKGEASALVMDAIGDALVLVAGLVAPDLPMKAGEALLKAFSRALVTKVGEAMKPDLEKLGAKAAEAMKAGKWKRARNLLDRIDKINARRAP